MIRDNEVRATRGRALRYRRGVGWALLALLLALAGPAVARPMLDAEGFTHYTLALTWHAGFCQTRHDPPRECREPALRKGAREGFVLHGLWPSLPERFAEEAALDMQMKGPLAQIGTDDGERGHGVVLERRKPSKHSLLGFEVRLTISLDLLGVEHFLANAVKCLPELVLLHTAECHAKGLRHGFGHCKSTSS